MSYSQVEAWRQATQPLKMILENNTAFARNMAQLASTMPLGTGVFHERLWNTFGAATELSARSVTIFERPEFGVTSAIIDGQPVIIKEEVVYDKAFGRGIRFARYNLDGTPLERKDPDVLLGSPDSGHFATLLRGTVQDMAVNHNVIITDSRNPRNISLTAGDYGFDDCVTLNEDAIHAVGSETHVISVCQPGPAFLSAIAQMAENDVANQPLSMTFMGSPMDAHAKLTQPVKLAIDNDMGLFRSMITMVPLTLQGGGRLVYPGHLQLMGFMLMNLDKHFRSHEKFFNDLCSGDHESAEAHREFYNEYLSVKDLAAKFYLETVERVFKDPLLPQGKLIVNGQLVRPELITDTALMTVGGLRDDITHEEQVKATHTICPNIPDEMRHHMNEDVGHYGLFNGSTFRTKILPKMTTFMREAGQKRGLEYSPPSPVPSPEQIKALKSDPRLTAPALQAA